ncbi:MAG TPA: hypothetical protein GXZ36_03265 [Firmicutes bacterium]|mgnify:FL=1|nr:hypothetical protein [Bacillota bacterium]
MSERFGETLKQRLNEYIGKTMPLGLTLQGWRYDLHDTKVLEVGLKNSRLGGPYTAPSVKRMTEGEIFLIWVDETGARAYTSGKIDLSTLESFTESLELWEKTAYRDEYGVDLVEPYEPPAVPLAHEQAGAIVEGAFSYPFQLLRKGQETLSREYGLVKVDGMIRITVDRRLVANSKGLWVTYEQTPVSIFFEGEDTFGDSFGEKRLPTEEEYNALLSYTGETVRQLKQEAPFTAEKEMYILLPPKVFAAFLGHYVVTNLSGGLVANRQSAFSKEDFLRQQQLFRADLTIRANGARPYRSSSYRCTGEGVPTGEVEYVKEGKLITPILNLKYAKRMEMKPTPIPVGGAGGLIIEANLQGGLDETLRTMGEVLIVHSILGLHTQDYSSGRFSLTADQCLLVKNGEVKGKTRTVIAGDFMGALRAKDTVFVTYPHEENPACCFRAYVTCPA